MKAARTFTPEDQDAFALLSGDYNPIHLDAVAARRLIFGRPVVHGIHALLWAIDRWAQEKDHPQRLKRLKVAFRHPVLVGEPVGFSARPITTERICLDVSADGVALLTATLTTEDGAGGGTDVQLGTPGREACHDREAAEMSAARGELPLYFDRELADQLFPRAARLLAVEQIAALLATSRLVGMEVPGLHSVYVGLELHSPDGPPSPGLFFRVEGYDERFSMLTIRVSSAGFDGTITAAARPRPRAQASFEEVRKLVKADEFRGVRALVIGGSRGLGEIAVKVLAAGGAEVRFSYHRGESDARAVAMEVAAGAGVAGYFAYDASLDSAQLPTLLGDWAPTWLSYFATPPIGSSSRGRFSVERFRELCDVHVAGFHRAVVAVRSLVGADLNNVFYPSTCFIDELPAGMGEYVAAKSAAEALCRFLEKTHPGVRFHFPRLPRLATDQNASFLSIDVADPTSVILDALRTTGARRTTMESR